MPLLPDPTTVVLESSALLSYLADESGGDVVEAVLRGAALGELKVICPALCLGETLIAAVVSVGVEHIDRLRVAVERLPLEVLSCDLAEAMDTALARLTWGLESPEAAAAAAAKQRSATLITANPQFSSYERAGGWVYWIGPEAGRNEPMLFDPFARFRAVD